ncbi:MAG: hypothetical protein AAF732_00215 [Pseudomonadota bacterium]
MIAGYIDWMFGLAALACGFGLSLATYRIFAVQNDWPMGDLHMTRPLIPILIGVFSLVIGFLFAADRGPEGGGWWIIGTGVLFAFFWTGFMRVASQMSLFLAPLATGLLLFGWIGTRPLSDVVYIPGYSETAAENARIVRPLSPRDELRRDDDGRAR